MHVCVFHLLLCIVLTVSNWSCFGYICYNNDIICFGGVDSDDKFLNNILIYSREDKKWYKSSLILNQKSGTGSSNMIGDNSNNKEWYHFLGGFNNDILFKCK